jgi:protein-S-isoprenylcysteine O-methyltransferase Ste14
VIQAVASLAFLGIFLLAGLDHRWGWSDVSLPLILAGDLLVLLGLGIVFLVFRENSYTSAVIDTTANQPVISTGPYALVRHRILPAAFSLLSARLWRSARTELCSGPYY